MGFFTNWCRDQFRIKVYYRGANDAFAQDYEKHKALGPKAEKKFFNEWASPSFHRYVDRMLKAEREKFMELYEDSVPMNTFIPGLGYKVKHRFSDDIVYVLDMGCYTNRGKRLDIDPSRERLRIAKRDEMKWYWHVTTPNNGDIKAYMRSCSYLSREVYVDRLKKQQKQALIFIKMMGMGDFVEGIGGKVESPYGHAIYILDC